MTTADFARKIRLLSLKAVFNAGCGHIGSSLSCADIIAVLYNEIMKVNPSSPQCSERDRFVLSKGHGCPALYAALAMKGFFDICELDNLRQIDGFLEGMPSMALTPGVDMSSGSLGMGVSAAAGMALASKINKIPYDVYCVTGDGELNEGQIWESFLFASQHNLSNLCVIVDKNGLQLSGKTSEILSCEPLVEKLEAFGASVCEIDGNSLDELRTAFADFKKEEEKFSVIVANTVKGKGVSFMENRAEWHGRVPVRAEYEAAEKELSEVFV